MSSPKTRFRIFLVAIFVIATIAGNVNDYLPNSTAVKGARLILDMGKAPFLVEIMPRWTLFVVGGGVLVLGPTTILGLWEFWWWSRYAAIGLTVVGLIIRAGSGPEIVMGIQGALFGLTTCLWAAALALTFCPPLAELFRRKQ